MNQLVTRGIVLSRINFGEADRILTLLTPDYGKLRLMARGVRKLKSKLAGGIELFSTSEIVFIRGKSEIGTLISARLDKHYGNIVHALDRVQLGYDIIKQLNRATEDEPETEYFTLLEQAFMALNEATIETALIRSWFQAQLLRLGGHAPNLKTDTVGKKLDPEQSYSFDFEAMTLTPRETGTFTAEHIKYLRLLFSSSSPQALSHVVDASLLLTLLAPNLQTMLNNFIRV